MLIHTGSMLNHIVGMWNHFGALLNHSAVMLNHIGGRWNHFGALLNHNAVMLNHRVCKLNHLRALLNHVVLMLYHMSCRLDHIGAMWYHIRCMWDHIRALLIRKGAMWYNIRARVFKVGAMVRGIGTTSFQICARLDGMGHPFIQLHACLARMHAVLNKTNAPKALSVQGSRRSGPAVAKGQLVLRLCGHAAMGSRIIALIGGSGSVLGQEGHPLHTPERDPAPNNLRWCASRRGWGHSELRACARWLKRPTSSAWSASSVQVACWA